MIRRKPARLFGSAGAGTVTGRCTARGGRKPRPPHRRGTPGDGPWHAMTCLRDRTGGSAIPDRRKRNRPASRRLDDMRSSEDHPPQKGGAIEGHADLHRAVCCRPRSSLRGERGLLRSGAELGRSWASGRGGGSRRAALDLPGEPGRRGIGRHRRRSRRAGVRILVSGRDGPDRGRGGDCARRRTAAVRRTDRRAGSRGGRGGARGLRYFGTARALSRQPLQEVLPALRVSYTLDCCGCCTKKIPACKP